MTREEQLALGLCDILARAKTHPAFDAEAFESRDVDSLVKQGGDICDWTMIAILADDALQSKQGEKA